MDSVSAGQKTKIIVGMDADIKSAADSRMVVGDFAYSIGAWSDEIHQQNMYLSRHAAFMGFRTQFNLLALNTFSSKHLQGHFLETWHPYGPLRKAKQFAFVLTNIYRRAVGDGNEKC